MTPPAPDAAFHWCRESWGLALRSTPLESIAQHLFTSRQLELPIDRVWKAARVRQVHGNAVRVIARGSVTESTFLEKPDGDAIVSNDPGLPLAVVVADCVPILLADRQSGAAAAIHAGWRGTCAGVARKAVETMQNAFGTRPADLVAAIGPSIGPEDYEVGEPLIDAFRAAGHAERCLAEWFSRAGGRLRLDLWAASRDQLVETGMKSGHISMSRLSTLPFPDVFHSYRRDGDRAGRMAAIIVVPSP